MKLKGQETMFITRQDIEHQEMVQLAPYAAKSKDSRGRKYIEEEHEYRTAYQRDRDRIMHTTAFRRLKYKTQVLDDVNADYHRNRLTHTLEAAQIARTVARTLLVNEDLTEAIVLAHDLGHPPFGHAGEDKLNELMREYGGFNHNIQSLRIVDSIEKRYHRFPGLNLTWEVREGIAKHGSGVNKPIYDLEPGKPPSIEAQIVDYADSIAYTAHDLDDSLYYGFLNADLASLNSVGLWQEAKRAIKEQFSELTRHRLIRFVIDRLVTDLIYTSSTVIDESNFQSPEDVRQLSKAVIGHSDEMLENIKQLRQVLFDHYYNHPDIIRSRIIRQKMLTAVFYAFKENPSLLPQEIQERVKSKMEEDETNHYFICDYIAGMTDRFLVETHADLFDPRELANLTKSPFSKWENDYKSV